jgi:hypothetical protein
VLLSFDIEVINGLAMIDTVPVFYALCINPLPYGMAHAIYIVVWTLGSMIPMIGIAIAIFELLYVTKFSTSFAWSPEKVGKLTFILIALISFIPFFLVVIVSTWQGGHAGQATAFLTGEPYQNSDPSSIMKFSAIFVLTCITIMVVMLSISFVFIPCYLRKYGHMSTESRNLSQSSSSFTCGARKLFLVCFAFGASICIIAVLQNKSQDVRVPAQALRSYSYRRDCTELYCMYIAVQ